MGLGIVLMWVVVFVIIFSGGNHQPVPPSPQVEHAWRLFELVSVTILSSFGLYLAAKMIWEDIRMEIRVRREYRELQRKRRL